MPTLYDIKPAFQRLLRPLAGGLVRAGATPNQVTIAALVLSLAVGSALVWRRERWVLLLVPAALLARMALNALDGMMAREHGLTSPLGAMLNELGDVLSDAALYLPLALWPGWPAPLLVALVVLAGLSEMAGVTALSLGASRRYDGPLGKSDRAFLFGALCLALGCGLTAGRWLGWLLAVAVALLAWTIVNRVRRALAEVAT
jgi:CDP-diacylglycerol--glycerol-3-phosphate 3-phosphatidyltransferase